MLGISARQAVSLIAIGGVASCSLPKGLDEGAFGAQSDAGGISTTDASDADSDIPQGSEPASADSDIPQGSEPASADGDIPQGSEPASADDIAEGGTESTGAKDDISAGPEPESEGNPEAPVQLDDGDAQAAPTAEGCDGGMLCASPDSAEQAPGSDAGPAADTTQLEPGLVLYYSFDEGAGAVAGDAVHPGDVGVIHGGASWTEGKFGTALSLEGSAAATLDPQYVELPGGVLQDLEETSIVAWVRWEGGPQWQRIFDFGSDTNRSFFMTPYAPDAPGTPDAGGALDLGLVAVRPSVEGLSQVHLQIQPSLPVAEWTHLTVTWSAAALVVYLNGQAIAKTPREPWAPAPGAGPVSLGEIPNAYIGRSLSAEDDYFAGSIDDFRIYDRALTQAEVVALRDSQF
jgi:hypothetical protein